MINNNLSLSKKREFAEEIIDGKIECVITHEESDQELIERFKTLIKEKENDK
ncbi:MAG: hypothetical protein V3V61_03940 [Gammaproteobacteria bacterium]